MKGLLIKDILNRDPSANPLVNNGQARITGSFDDRERDELCGELSTFVCEGQYADGMVRILESFLRSLDRTNQPAAWVSGFYGSGKSHLLKMLCHLWKDTPFPGGATARSLVPDLPDEVHQLLKELDTAARRGGGLLAAAGALPSGTADNVRLTILGILLKEAGLPDQFPLAQFSLWLREEGHYEQVKKAVEDAGKSWTTELTKLYVSPHIAKALLKCDRGLAANEMQMHETLRAQFPPAVHDITTADFVGMAKRALAMAGKNNKMPCTILVLDEVQQYIGTSADRSRDVAEAAEAMSKQLDSTVMIVAAGQSALSDQPLLTKLTDRFTIPVPLSDTDVETVTRKVILAKKPAVLDTIRDELKEHAGEISRQLQGTRIGERAEDRDTLLDDYPLLPVRRRFWEACFRVLDTAGTQSQLRSQLRIIHDAVADMAKQEVGCVIPGDVLYDALAPKMVETGVLLREISERITNLTKKGGADGRLAARICGLVFLIGKLPRESGADTGVRATREMIADLLVDDLRVGSAKLREKVEAALSKLVSDGALMPVGDEYRLQTREGSEWDKDLKQQQAKLLNNDAEIAILRDQLFRDEIQRISDKIKIAHGAPKERRTLELHFGDEDPEPSLDHVIVWVRDAWNASDKEVSDAARKAGVGGSVIYVFIPKTAPDDLRRCVVSAAATKRTLEHRGTPATDEGREAQRSMDSRLTSAIEERDALVREIVANAKVLQAGPNELHHADLSTKIAKAAEVSLVRLFPRFRDADVAGWETALKRAREGAENPLQAVTWTGATDKHPVSQQVLLTIGAGALGGEVRRTLRAAQYGWPQDAIDAVLIALHRSSHLRATLNGVVLKAGQLDQTKIPKTEFRVEGAALSIEDKLKLRGLFQKVLGACKAGQETELGGQFLEHMSALAVAAGGVAPLPPPPDSKDIDELKLLAGNDQLVAILRQHDALAAAAGAWRKSADLAQKRSPGWYLLQKLARHAADISDARDDIAQIEAIRDGRQLLDPTDRVTPTKAALVGKLRSAVTTAYEAHTGAVRTALDGLDRNDTWKKVPREERAEILRSVGLELPTLSPIGTDEDLLATLDRLPLPARRSLADAVAGQEDRALMDAARRLEPKVQPFQVERVTLHSPQDVKAWLGRQEESLLKAVARGPVVVT